jgi:hypothetical protein
VRVWLAVAATALLVLSGCGGGSGSGANIPRDKADHMIALIQQADTQAAAGVCGGADAKVREAQGVLDTLPARVGKSLRQGLADSMSHLRVLIATQCQRPQTQTTPTQTQTTPTQTQTTPTETTQTQTTPTDTTPTTPTTTTQTQTTQTQTTPTSTGNGGVPTGTGAIVPPSGDGGTG